MFDIAPSELLLVAIVAIVVIGPKDLPLALRTAGRWIAKVRRVSNHFRSGIETMIREAELEEMERKWREQNAAIMASDAAGTPPSGANPAAEGQTPAAAVDQVPRMLPLSPEIAAHAPTEPTATEPSAPAPPAPATAPDPQAHRP